MLEPLFSLLEKDFLIKQKKNPKRFPQESLETSLKIDFGLANQLKIRRGHKNQN